MLGTISGTTELAQFRSYTVNIGSVNSNRPKMIRMKTIFISVFLLLGLSTFAQVGLPDINFGVNGIASVDLGDDDEFQDLKVLPDGKILCFSKSIEPGTITSRFPTLCRLNPDGSLDPTFGTGGKVILDTQVYLPDLYYALTVDALGRILVVFQANPNMYVQRFTADGTVDTNFSFDGQVIIDLGSDSEYPHDILVQSDGKILTFCSYANDFAFARLNEDGTFDTSFGTNGKQIHNVTAIDKGLKMALQADGKILACGTTDDGFGNTVGLIRLNTDGTLDTSFDGDGKVTRLINANDSPFGLTVQSDGKIIVAGGSRIALQDQSGFVLRFNTDGSADNSFDTDGMVLVNISGLADAFRDVLLQPDGKILTAGVYDITTGDVPFWVTRLNTDGTLDTDFSTDGSTTVGLSGFDTYARAMDLTPSGDLIVGGYENSAEPDIRLLKLKTGLNIGVKELETKSVSIYPNPTTDVLNLDLSEFEAGIKAVRVFDGTGRLVHESSTDQSKIRLELELLADGVYTGTIVSKNQVATVQFSKN